MHKPLVYISYHTSHAIQPLDVACFKPFKATFRKERNVPKASKHYIKLDKTLATWVHKALESKTSNMDSGFWNMAFKH
jgi:hypothetical protein